MPQMHSVDYYCGIDDPARLERKLLADGGVIVSRRMKQFIDSPAEEQFTVAWPDGYHSREIAAVPKMHW